MFNNKISTKLLIKNTINNAILSNKFPQIDIKPFYGVTNNIRSTLIHEKIINNSYNFKSKKCENGNCGQCLFVNIKNKIISMNGLELPVLCNSNCSALDCLYILKCNICNSYYVGQTCNFKQRFDKHLSTIRNHLKFNNYINCELATHFNTDLTHRNNWEESRVFKCDMLLEYILTILD
jgi:hypothetical protein